MRGSSLRCCQFYEISLPDKNKSCATPRIAGTASQLRLGFHGLNQAIDARLREVVPQVMNRTRPIMLEGFCRHGFTSQALDSIVPGIGVCPALFPLLFPL